MYWSLPLSLLDAALLWQPVGILTRSEEDTTFPSWSWAGWTGSVEYEEPYSRQKNHRSIHESQWTRFKPPRIPAASHGQYPMREVEFVLFSEARYFGIEAFDNDLLLYTEPEGYFIYNMVLVESDDSGRIATCAGQVRLGNMLRWVRNCKEREC